jgi:transposase
VGHRLSEATVLNSCHQLADKVSPVTQIIKEKLKGAEVVNFDETGLRVNGKLHWLHCASTDQLTDYLVHPRRGQEAIDTMGILPNLKGVACHDHWKPYFNYEVRHSLCNAHHLRELTFIEKQYQQAFAPKMADLLIEINSAKKEQSADHFDPETLTAYFSRYDEIVNEGLTANPEKRRDPDQKPKRGRVKQTPAHNLLKRLRDFKRAVLLFMVDFNVPFTNNQAEQDVRMVKVKQKVSGCFRTLTGAEEFAASRGYISTARKNDQNIFQAIRSAFDNRPFIPAF